MLPLIWPEAETQGGNVSDRWGMAVNAEALLACLLLTSDRQARPVLISPWQVVGGGSGSGPLL